MNNTDNILRRANDYKYITRNILELNSSGIDWDITNYSNEDAEWLKAKVEGNLKLIFNVEVEIVQLSTEKLLRVRRHISKIDPTDIPIGTCSMF
ncbi:hypothetical protein [Marinifilum flexuosum]|uniref:hypothetical protein n=1 Tax=Marinifilum flexuosum TaxID=1117708 RepID=UPI00249559F7|nr:hypothetical protein [Marinifilum flexuosum]